MPEQDLIEAVKDLAARRYRGDINALINHYAPSGFADRDVVTALLKDAGVGTRFTRWIWVDGIMQVMDSNLDGRISQAEFLDAITKRG